MKKRPGLTVQVDDSNSKTPRIDAQEAASQGLQLDMGGSFGGTYDMSESGTFNVDGFKIRETGITEVPDRYAESGAPSSDPSGMNMKNDLIKLCVLGRGASGVVYKAVHIPTLRIVGIKTIPVFEQDKRHQMVRELKALYNNLVPITGDGSTTRRGSAATGVCPHIVSFYDAWANPDEGSISIAVEYMDGGSLQDIVDTAGCRAESVLANIAFRVLLGLQFVHRGRTIHRDIKPSNLLINHLGDVKVSDFGIVREMDSTLAKAHTFVGTLTYMSPERISGEEYSYESDVWSFGLSLMTIALGEYPFNTAGGYWGLLHTLRDEEVPLLPDDDFSPEFIDFIARCMVKVKCMFPAAGAQGWG
jgi:serine/threonine protein kinase